jgi:6-phosphofructokinase 1
MIEMMGPEVWTNTVNKGGTVLKSARSLEFRTPEGRKAWTSC